MLCLLVIASFSPTCYAQNEVPATSIDSIIEKIRLETGIVGMSAAIIKHKKVVWMKGYGYADEKANIPFTASTVMNVASISKTFTGVCIMKASPEPLGHFVKNYFVMGGSHYSKENFLQKKPGTYREYSNIGAALAGYIVEFATGQKLNIYGKQYIFEPLKMEHTGWLIAEVDLKRHSKLYDKKSDGIKEIPLYGLTTYPDGGVRTSVASLSKFFISLLNQGEYKHTRILKEESVAEMTKFQYTALNKPENVNIEKLNQGVFWATKLGATRMGHNGSDHGVRTFMLSDIKKEIGVVIFFNTSLGEEKEGKYFDVYEALYKYAETLGSKELQ